MKRHLLNLLTALSLLLCMAVCVLWVRSHVRHDVLRFHASGGDRWGVSSGRGTLCFEHHSNEISHGPAAPRGWDASSRAADMDFRTAAWQNPAAEHRVFGYGVVVNRGVAQPTQRSARPGAWRNAVLILPYWLFAALSAPLPAVWVVRRVRRMRRRDAGLCPTCGYDLRATPGRCPECGSRCGGT